MCRMPSAIAVPRVRLLIRARAKVGDGSSPSVSAVSPSVSRMISSTARLQRKKCNSANVSEPHLGGLIQKDGILRVQWRQETQFTAIRGPQYSLVQHARESGAELI